MSLRDNATIRTILAHPVFRFFASLKLAVFVLLSLSLVLGAATVLESIYGTRAVYLMVYGTWWFYGLLSFLALNVLCAALSRYPWKKHQIGFLVTHTGILVILFGSWLTMQFGVDGNLPVVEGEADNRVILSGLTLTVMDEEANKESRYPVHETPLAEKGELMEIALPTGDRLVVTEFLPRVVMQRRIARSPVEGVGSPAVRLELFNERFRVEEWLMDAYPGKGHELSLGPAVLRFRKLWTPAEEKAFLAPRKPEKEDSVGYLIFDYRGKTYRVPVESALRRWRRLGSEELEVKIERYLPYAIVRDGQLVSKSDEPVNPAVQLLIRDKRGTEEKHSVFAVFPEFSTMHKSHRNDGRQFGVKIRMVSSAAKDDSVSDGQGRLDLAQSADDGRLLYRVLGRDGETNAQGEVKVGQDVITGWMDLRFKVAEWIPQAVAEVNPHYVEEVAGTDNNFLTGLYVEPREVRSQASESRTGFWLSEGQSRTVALGGRKLLVQLSRHSIPLPFEIFLEKFHIGTDPGTNKAASYESKVKVKDGPRGEHAALISMNEPLHYGGYTFYQASYQLREGAPPVSVFSVNFDPGRMVKYLGSLIMCLGITVMFWMNPHYWNILLGFRRNES